MTQRNKPYHNLFVSPHPQIHETAPRPTRLPTDLSLFEKRIALALLEGLAFEEMALEMAWDAEAIQAGAASLLKKMGVSSVKAFVALFEGDEGP